MADPLSAENLSDKQRNLLAIVRAGKDQDLDEFIDDTVKTTARQYESVRSDDEHSESWKAEQTERIHTAARAKVDQQIDKLAASIVDTTRSDYAKVFGVEGVQGEAASLAISRRDAGDRVAALATNRDLLDMLERAELSGDEVLARAVADRAFQLGALGVVDRFIEPRPSLHEPARRLGKARRNQDRDTEYLFHHSMRMASLKPAYISTDLRVR